MGRKRRSLHDVAGCRAAGSRLVPAPRSASLSPAAARDLILMNSQADVRHVLSAVQCPTLVLHRTGDLDSRIDEGGTSPTRFPSALRRAFGRGARAGADPDEIVDEVEEFLTGVRPTPTSDRMLATLLFTDIVGSTKHAESIGDAAWASLLGLHNEAVRLQLVRFSGRRSTPPETVFSRSSTAPRGRFCAVAIRDALEALTLDVRAGAHRRGRASRR